MTAILMVGWSTAVVFEVLMKTLEHRGSTAIPARLSVLQIEASEPFAIKQHDLALCIADEAENIEIVQA
jgi:hypothetical protein